MAWYDKLDPTTPAGMQLGGLLGGLGALGAGLMQAGQMRPLGAPGPTLADAFGAFGAGQQRGLMNAAQSSAIQKQMARQSVFAEARSDKPDEAISQEALAIRKGLSSLPEDARPFVDSDTAGQLVMQRATSRMRPMTAEELAAGGFRPGSVVMVNDFTGTPSVLQQPDTMSPEAEAQRLRIQAAGREPRITWQDVRDDSGNLVGQRSSTGQFQPMQGPGFTQSEAWNTILRLQPLAQSGRLDPSTPDGQRYIAAQTMLTQPRPVQVTGPDGAVYQVMQSPQFPFPMLQVPGAAPATGTPAAAPAPTQAQPATPAPAVAAGSPVAVPGVPAGAVPIKPPAALTEAQSKANMFGLAMAEGDRIISEVGTPSSAAIIAWRNIPEAGLNPMLSAKDQQYFNALRQFAAGVLRKETGAAFTPNELLDVQSRFFPMPGDDQKTKEQKARARRQAIEAMRAETPGGFRGQIEPPEATPRAPTAAPTMRWNPQTGRVEPIR